MKVYLGLEYDFEPQRIRDIAIMRLKSVSFNITEPNRPLATNLFSAAKVSLDLPHFLFQFFLSAICGD